MDSGGGKVKAGGGGKERGRKEGEGALGKGEERRRNGEVER